MNTINPPIGFNTSFFDWLGTIGNELSVNFIERGGLSPSEISVFEQEIGGDLPTQIRVYYENCNPWAIWKNPLSLWRRIQRDIGFLKKTNEPILPIDINSQQGNYTIARVLGPNEYEIIDIKRDGAVKPHKGDLRSYFVEAVQEEIRRSTQ